MKNKSVILVLILMFGVALGAGVVAEKLSLRVPGKEATPAPERGTLSDALKLSPDQREKMQSIWEGIQGTSLDCLTQAQQAQREQDDALMAILTDEQRKKYSDLTLKTQNRIAVLDAKRKDAFRKGVEQTNQILDEPQRKLYQQIIKDKVGGLSDSSFNQISRDPGAL